MIKGWQTIERFDDEGSAQAMAGRLRIEGVPVAVQSDHPVPGVGTFCVVVPTELAHRARSILVQAEGTEAELSYLATGELGPLKESRYENGRPMLFAGIRRHHEFARAGEDIPRQWQDFEKLGKLPGQVGTTAYGAICGGDPKTQTMEYMCAVEVASFDGLPKELGRMRVPAARYAVFRHDDNVSTVRATWDRIFSQWLPSSSLRSANTPDFEVYDERFDPVTGEGGIEIWVPVVAEVR